MVWEVRQRSNRIVLDEVHGIVLCHPIFLDQVLHHQIEVVHHTPLQTHADDGGVVVRILEDDGTAVSEFYEPLSIRSIVFRLSFY